MIQNIITGFFARASVALLNLLILLLATRQLGSELWGQVSLLVLNITIVHGFNEIYTGAALVYYIPKTPLQKLYQMGFWWMVSCSLFINLVFLFFSVGPKELWPHVFFLSLLVTLNGFHNVLLLGKEHVKLYNLMVVLQPAILYSGLLFTIFVLNLRSIEAYLWAMYLAFGLPMLLSGVWIIKLGTKDQPAATDTESRAIFSNGFVNQLGNLAHTLSNRFNYYMLGSAALVGVYASATSLIESLWIISGSVSPLVLTRVANRRDPANSGALTFLLSKVCFLLSLAGVVTLYFLPTGFFTAILGKDFSFIKSVMLYLSPGVLAISFSNIISHYFSGQGKQRILLLANSFGLATTLATCHLFIQHFGISGACYTASVSYLVQATVLTIVFMKTNALSFWELFKLKIKAGDLTDKP